MSDNPTPRDVKNVDDVNNAWGRWQDLANTGLTNSSTYIDVLARTMHNTAIGRIR